MSGKQIKVNRKVARKTVIDAVEKVQNEFIKKMLRQPFKRRLKIAVKILKGAR